MNRYRFLIILFVAVLVPALAYGKVHKVAYFASSSQNSFNQAVYEGVQEKASEIGNVETTIFDGRFDAQVQYNQVEDAIASNKFDAFIIFASDTVGISSVVDEAIKKNIKVVAAFFPIGPDLNTLEPQVEGLTSTVGRPPAYGAKIQAEAVVEYCRDKDPCNVVIMVGQKIYPFDNLRYMEYQKVLSAHKNIDIVATVEGNYSPDISLAGMQDVMQSGKKIHAIISNADQHVDGAEIALEDAGYKPEDVFLVGSGASKRSVAKVKAGKWDATLLMLPKTLGKLALEQAVLGVEGKQAEEVVNMDTKLEYPSLLTTQNSQQLESFVGEWE